MKTAYGHVVVVDVPSSHVLHPGERALTTKFGAKRLATFTAGRHALREALREAGVVVDGAILRDDRGAPVLPAGVGGSITHKDTVAAAVVEADVDGSVGIDLEIDDGRDAKSTDALAQQVLTPRELKTLPDELEARRREVFTRFSLKEALYKAIDPYVRRYVGFKEVEVEADGTLIVDRVGSFSAHGCSVDVGRPGIILTLARVVRR